MEHDIVLTDEVYQTGILVLPPLFPVAPLLRLTLAELLRIRHIADGRIEPNVQHLTVSSFYRYGNAPVEVACHRTRLKVHVEPRLALAIDVGTPLLVTLQNPLLQPLLILVQRQIPVLRLLHDRCRTADGRLRIDELCRREVATALLTLVTIGTLVVTVGTLAHHVTIGQELLGLLVVELSGGLLHQLALVVKLLEPLSSKLMVGRTCGATINVKRNTKLLERVLDHLVITVHNILRGDALLTSTNSDGHAMLVASTDEHHIALLQSQVTYIDVGRYIDTCQVTNMNATIGVRQRRGHRDSLILFLFHIINNVYLGCKDTPIRAKKHTNIQKNMRELFVFPNLFVYL